jgi:hemerythrin superfamily protein
MRTASRLPASSSTSGTGDALDQLQQDHRQVETLFARAALSPGATRADVVRLITQALTVHAELEEAVVYPAIADALGAGRPLVDQAVAEHGEMKALIARLEGSDLLGPEVLDEVRALQLVVQQHVAVEEGEVFPAFRAKASADDMERLSRDAERARRAAKQAGPARPAAKKAARAKAAPGQPASKKAASTRRGAS